MVRCEPVKQLHYLLSREFGDVNGDGTRHLIVNSVGSGTRLADVRCWDDFLSLNPKRFGKDRRVCSTGGPEAMAENDDGDRAAQVRLAGLWKRVGSFERLDHSSISLGTERLHTAIFHCARATFAFHPRGIRNDGSGLIFRGAEYHEGFPANGIDQHLRTG
jgi:hypothetical protein